MRDERGRSGDRGVAGSALEAARIARENGNKRGETFLKAAADTGTLASGQGRIGPTHRLHLASIWARNGLQTPGALELTPQAMGVSVHAGMPKDRAETFLAMPPELSEHVVVWSMERPEPIHARLVCFGLLDPSPSVRLAADLVVLRS